MRSIYLLFALFFSLALNAQSNDHDQKAVCTRYEDGSFKETGFLKDGKLDGRWVKYNESGEAITIAYFDEGKKVGSWLFVNSQGEIKEVEFINNKAKSTRTYVFDTPTSIIGFRR